MRKFQFADLHCHPNLKTFGKSFSNSKRDRVLKSNFWYSKLPNFFTKWMHRILGITKFSQSDFTTMAKGNVKIAFVSLYPFEKGFFTNPYINNKLYAILASFVTSIGYHRVRYIQNHLDYFKDLMNEYNFLQLISKTSNKFKWSCGFVESITDITNSLENNFISIIPTIEGAHVFNSGLSKYGKPIDEQEILSNIIKVKQLPYSPFFITFAHNFNNDLCGHAPSLEVLGALVDQSENLNAGFTSLGLKVLHLLLDNRNEKRIYIDVKHMSLKSRMEYYHILKTEYNNSIPVIVSHGAVTGTDVCGDSTSTLNPEYFSDDSINFYDEELIIIAKSCGLFAIQMDEKRLVSPHVIKKSLFKNNKTANLKFSTLIIWRQLQHVAEILDANGHDSWRTCCIGSDFDGTINPLEEILTATDLNRMANELLNYVENYLSKPNSLSQNRNKNITALQVVENFTITNAENFIKNNFNSNCKDN